MTPIYSIFPLEPGVRAWLETTMATNAPASNGPCDAFKQHWVVTLTEGVCVLANTFSDSSDVLRVKRIEYAERQAYLLKTSRTRARIIAYSDGQTIHMVAAKLPGPDITSPKFPNYPRSIAEGCELSSWGMNDYSVLAEMSRYAAKFLTAPTIYCEKDYPRKPISTSGIKAFWYGTVLSVEQGDSPDLWRITAKNTDCERVLQIHKNALRVKWVKLGTTLIYSTPSLAEIIRPEDLQTFYKDVSGTDEQ